MGCKKLWMWLNREILKSFPNKGYTPYDSWYYEDIDKDTMYIANRISIFKVPKKYFYLDKKVFINGAEEEKAPGGGVFNPKQDIKIQDVINTQIKEGYSKGKFSGILFYLDDTLGKIKNKTTGESVYVNYKYVEKLSKDYSIKSLEFYVRSSRDIICCKYKDEIIAYFMPFMYNEGGNEDEL